MADQYPVLVLKLNGGDALDMGCNACGHWWPLDDPEEFMRVANVGTCPRCKSFKIEARYMEASACPGCGEINAELDRSGPLKGACSRRCMLTAEYAATLKEG